MEITLSFREADNLFSSLFADGNGSERKKQAAYLMVGGKGFGKSELLNRISRRLEQSNFRVHRVRSYGINGGLKFHAFNEVINQILGEIEERPMGKIVDFFQRYQFDNGGMTCIIVDAIERMEQESRNLFLFLSRLAQRKNFVLIGALTENGNNREEQVFLDIATSEEDLEIIRLKKPSYDDIKYYLEESGYLVPEHFSKELYRLINGNFQLLAYCLRYYEEQGIINSNKQLEEVSYRFFPIPPNLEVHYSRLLTSLPTEQRQILEILALVGEELEPGFISKLTGFKLGDVVRSLEDLRDRGFIVENNMNFAVVNATVADIVTKSISRESIVMEESFTTSDAFIALSVLTRLRVYTKLRDRKSIEALINENWEDLYDNIANLSVSSSFFFDIQRNMESEEAKNKVSILIAALLINEGQLDQAMNLLQDPRLEKVYQDLVQFLKGRVLQRLNKFNDSNEILKKLVSKNDLSPKIMGNALVLQSLNYYDLGMLDEQLAVSEEALRIAEEYGLEDVIADALNGIANVKIKKYEIDEAEALYKKALDINRRLRKMDRILLTNNNLAIIWSYKGQMKESADLLKEVIEGSYITGDIQSRAYASYNISEIYFNAGEFGEAMKYIPYALKLVQKLNDTNLSFPFYRFLVTISISLFRLRMAKQYVGELLSVANVVGDQRMIRQAEGLNTLIGVIEGNVPENTLDSFFDIELREGDDYTPIWYSIGVMHFSLSRKLNKAEECLKKSREAAQHLGDYYGSLISHVAEIYILLAKGDSEKILSFIRDMRESGRKLLIFENQMRLIEGLYKSEKGSTAEYTPESILDLIGATEFEHLSLKRKGGAVYDLLRKRYYAAMELRTEQQGVI